MTTAIDVRDVSKSFRHRPHVGSLKELALRGFRGARGRRVAALEGVSFAVAAGETVGIVGPNGAGKSTLLRLIGGVGRPDRGRITATGRLSAVLELGTGFHPELTGREAATLAGVIAGFTRREIRRRLDDIVGFAGLEEFIDDPLRTYSSGMQSRLGFSIAINVQPDVLLVDEVLAVGDRGFQQRCIDRIRHIQRDGTTVVLVSHDEHLVADLCDRVVWLRGGRVAAIGPPNEIVARYVEAVRHETEAITPLGTPLGRRDVTATGNELVLGTNRMGSQEGTVESVALVDRWGAHASTIRSGEPFTVEAVVRLPERGGGPEEGVLAVTVVRDGWLLVIDTSVDVRRSGRVRLRVERLDLGPGHYDVSVGLYGRGWAPTWDYHDRAYSLRVVGEASSAVLAPPLAWEQDSAVSATNRDIEGAET